MRMPRRFAWGVAAAALYVGAVAAFVASGQRILPLLDGSAPPPPYRWVNPPPEAAASNQPAAGGELEIPLEGETSGQTGYSEDGQLLVTVGQDALPKPEGQRAVLLDMQPLDPETLGPPPEGLEYDGNAYRVGATYVPSGEEVELTGPATVILRYPTHAVRILRRDGVRWEALPTTAARSSLQVFTDTPELGTFVAAARPPAAPPFPWVWVGAGAATLAAVVALVLARRGRAPGGRGAPKGRTKR